MDKVALGRYSDYNQAVSNMVRYSKVYYPDKKNAEIYIHLYIDDNLEGNNNEK